MSWDLREDECRELGQAAAYVLRALEDDEAERYREHLDGCSLCAAEVSRLQPVVDALPASLPRVTVSPDLRARVMASVRAEADLLQAAGASADRVERPRRRLRLRRPQLLVVAAALSAGLLIGAVAIGGGSKAPTQRVTTAFASAPAGAHAVLREVGGRAELVVSGVAQPPHGKIYEVWLARAGAPHRRRTPCSGSPAEAAPR